MICLVNKIMPQNITDIILVHALNVELNLELQFCLSQHLVEGIVVWCIGSQE